MTAFNAQYFIEKFEAIPEAKWTSGTLADSEGRSCALGHCGETEWGNPTNEGLRLRHVLLYPDVINDGRQPGYRQETPKQRILSALRDAKERGL